MLIVVDPESGVPVYRQLMDQIKFHISTGLLPAGHDLPSTRALSAELGVNPMTVSKAYSFLERERVLVRRPGRPLVVNHLQATRLEAERLARLRQSLVQPATVARQLGLGKEVAVRLFEEMLAAEPPPPERDGPGGGIN
jgi:GntR family transcriptional regulator